MMDSSEYLQISVTFSLTHKSTLGTLIKIYFILDFCFIYLAEERTDGCDEPADKQEKHREGNIYPKCCAV